MSTAAIAIDNFLDSDKWNTIQSGISGYLNSSDYSSNRTSLHTQINSWVQEKLTSLNLWQSAWESDVKLFSSLNVLPSICAVLIMSFFGIQSLIIFQRIKAISLVSQHYSSYVLVFLCYRIQQIFHRIIYIVYL